MPTIEIDGDARASRALRRNAGLDTRRLAKDRRIGAKARRQDQERQALRRSSARARSGRLRQSIAARLEESGATISAVGVKLAAAQEYGFDGEESVRAHSRAIREAFGRAITPKTIFVQAFSRHMRLEERSYMRSSLAEMQDNIAAALREAVDEGLAA